MRSFFNDSFQPFTKHVNGDYATPGIGSSKNEHFRLTAGKKQPYFFSKLSGRMKGKAL